MMRRWVWLIRRGLHDKAVSLLVLVAVGWFFATGLREIGGYPRCPADEAVWGVILDGLANGVDWPVSGPLFVWLARLVGQIGNLSSSVALAVLGELAVPVVLGIAFWAYGRLAPLDRRWLLPVLLTSSYFWAPLLESRPQQWGQFLVLAGNVAFWLGYRGRLSWWPFVGVLGLTALFHLLSFAILLWCVLAIWLFLAWVKREGSPAGMALPLLAMCGAVLVVMWPAGPYRAMLVDIREHQWHGPMTVLPILAGMFLLLLIAGTRWAVQGFTNRFSNITRSLTGQIGYWLDERPAFFLMGTSLLALLALLMQASLLPSAAWQPYRGSWGIFVVAQSGNLFFLGLWLGGLLEARRSYLAGRQRERIEITLVLSVALAVLSSVALVGSLAMLHTNWMLRVIDYAVLVTAPLAALGLRRWLAGRAGRAWRWLIVLLFCGISLLSTLHPSAMFDCAVG
jgi:hypothetical protein